MWENILQKGNLSNHAKKLLDEVIDSEPRSASEILDRIYNEMEKRRKELPSSRSRISGTFIPTRKELTYYLNKNYNSAKFSKITGKRVKGSSHDETKYWK